jgi:hypothetical protein
MNQSSSCFSRGDLPDGLIFRIPVKVSREVLIRFIRNKTRVYVPRRPAPIKGRIAIVTDVGCGMRWTLWLRQTSADQSGRRRRVVLPLPHEIRTIRCLTGILRSLTHLGFFPVCLTVWDKACRLDRCIACRARRCVGAVAGVFGRRLLPCARTQNWYGRKALLVGGSNFWFLLAICDISKGLPMCIFAKF